MKSIFRNIAFTILLVSNTVPALAQDDPPKSSALDRFNNGAKGIQADPQKTQKSSALDRFNSGAKGVQATDTRARESVEKAIKVLIPGGIEKGSAREEQLGIAIDAFLTGNAAKALETLKALKANDAEMPPGEFVIAGLSFAVGDAASGTRLLESNAIRYPDYPGIYLSFAQLAINNNRITDAAIHAEKVQSLINKGEFSETWRKHFIKQYYEIITSVHLARNETAAADTALERLQKSSPDLPFYFLSKAKLALETGQNPQAIEYLRQYNDAVDNTRLPELTLVTWLRKRGKIEEAKQLLITTASEHSDDATGQMMLAEMYLSEENFRGGSGGDRAC